MASSTPIPVWLHTPPLPWKLHGQVWCPIPALWPCWHYPALPRFLCNLSPWRSHSHWSRSGTTPRYLERVPTWREGGVGSKGSGITMERPLKVGTCCGVVQTRQSPLLLRENLCFRKFGAPTLNCVPTSWYQSSQTCRLVEDPWISSLKLLVATDVSLHQSICEDMWSPPSDWGAASSSDWRICSAPYSRVPLGHHQRQLHHWAPRVSRLRHGHECCGLHE